MQLTQDIDYGSMTNPKQMANHIPGLKYITQKQRLFTLMEDFYWDTCGDDLYKKKLFELVPKTYRLDNSADTLAFLNDSDEGIYVQKRFFMNRGMGIKLIYDINEYKKELSQRKKFTPDYSLKASVNGNKYKELMYLPPSKDLIKQQQDEAITQTIEEKNETELQSDSKNVTQENP